MKKKVSFNTPRFQIIFFDTTFSSGIVKPYDKNRNIMGQYKEYFENSKISEACKRIISNISDLSILFDNQEEKL